MILKKKLEKINYDWVVKINQTQAYHLGENEDYDSVKTENTVEKFQEQKLKLSSNFVCKNTQQKRKVINIKGECWS